MGHGVALLSNIGGLIKRIVLENFMSHRRSVIEPADGLTVLTGPNNCGKSAVVTALQTLCENERGSQMFVRHGEKASKVTVETGEGSVLEWRREGNTVSYRINGREVHRLRGSVPEDLHEHLRMTPVSAAEGAEPFQVHFSEQKDPIFLLNETPGRAATFFASASDTRLLLKMQKLAQERRKAAKQEADQTQRRLDNARERLDLFAPVESLERDLSEASEMHCALTNAIADEGKLWQMIQAVGDNAERVQYHRERSGVLGVLEVPPHLVETDSLDRLLAALEIHGKSLVSSSSRKDALDVLAAPPVLEDTSSLASVVRTITETASRIEQSVRKTSALSNLEPPVAQQPEDDLRILVRRMTLLQSSERLQSRLAGGLVRLPAPPERQETEPFDRMIQGLMRREGNLTDAQTSLERASEALATARAALVDYVGDHPSCPLCGNRLDAESVLSGGHLHA